MNFDEELMMNKWNILPDSKSDLGRLERSKGVYLTMTA